MTDAGHPNQAPPPPDMTVLINTALWFMGFGGAFLGGLLLYLAPQAPVTAECLLIALGAETARRPESQAY